MTKTTIPVSAEKPIRLDKFLTEKLSDLSRSQIQKLIKKNQIRVNGQLSKSNLLVTAGDTITIADAKIPENKTKKINAQSPPTSLDIIYQDKNLAIIDKPSGLVVHPDNTGHHEHTLTQGLVKKWPSIARVGDPLRPGIVHRLDKDTSGLLIVAKTQPTYEYLVNLFKKHAIEKTYLALIKGHPKTNHGLIDAAIYRDPKNRKKMAISHHSQAKSALTEFTVLQQFDACTLVEVTLHTGRTHQIRVHFSSISHPVVGDTVYGERTFNRAIKEAGLNRIFLHAHKLSFTLPDQEISRKKAKNKATLAHTKKPEFISPLPKDLSEFLQLLTQHSS